MSRVQDHKPGSTRIEEHDANVAAPGRSTLAAALAPAETAPASDAAVETRARPLPRLDLTTGNRRPLPRLDLGGTSLPTAQRTKFEQSLKTDLSHVRLHTNEAAGEAAKEQKARAFAVGSDIVFGEGQYQPGTPAGDQLLAHEVAHTVQQSGSPESGELQTTQPGDGVERNADAAANAMVAGQAADVAPAPQAIARKRLDEEVAPEPAAAPETAAESAAGGEPAKDKKPDEEGEIGELSAQRVGQVEDEGEGNEPISPIPNTEAGKAQIASQAQALPPDGGAEELAGGGPQAPAPAGGGGGEEVALSPELQQSITEAQADAKAASVEAQAEAAAFKAEMAAERDRFDEQQHALTLEQLKGMSGADKRATLVEMGYDQKSVKKMKDAELDGVISGRIETEQRKTKILGMDPEELAALSPQAKAQFLVDLGIDKKDVDKIGVQAAARGFDEIMRVAHVPGQHKVKIKVKGGLLAKSWEVSVKVDAQGSPEIEAKKKGGFLSKLWGWVKLALPVIALVLAPITAGASLIALAVYQTVTSIASGDWLGAIVGAAGAMVGLGAIAGIGRTAQGAATAFGKIADVAGKVQKVAQAAQASMGAAKAKNAGSLLAALSSGAGAFAGFAGNQAGKFATTMRRWSEKLDRWGKMIAGGEKVVKGVKSGNAGTALAGAFEAAAAGVSKKDDKGQETSAKAKDFTRYAKLASYAAVGQNAAKQDPPGFGEIVDAAMGMAGELKLIKKEGNAAKITAAATRLGVAIASKDPSQLAAAALGLAETIHMAKFNAEDDSAESQDDKAALVEKYARANRVVNVAAQAIAAASKKPRPDYASALDAAAQMVAEFTEDKRLDEAATVTQALDRWTKAIQSKDDRAIIEAGFAFGEAIGGMRTAINEERAKSKAAAEAKLEPGETLPVEVSEVPSFDATPELLPSTSLDLGLVGEPVAIDPSLPTAPRTTPIDPRTRASTPNANYTVIAGDTLSELAQMFGTTVSALRAANPQLADGKIFVGQGLHIPGMETVTVRGDAPGQETGQGTGSSTTRPPGKTPTTTPGTPTAPGGLPEIPREFLDAVKLFGDAMGQFDHPVVKAAIGQLLAAHKVVAGVAKDGVGYADAVALLKAAHANAKLREIYFKQIEGWKVAPDNPNRADLMKLQRLTRQIGRGLRAAEIPLEVIGMADNLLTACGFSTDGKPVTTEEQLLAAKALLGLGHLYKDITWLLEVGTALEARFVGTEIVATMNAIRNAAASIGDDVATQTMKHLTPLLRKAQGKALNVAGRGIVEAYGLFGTTLRQAATRALIKNAVSTLGVNILRALRVAGGPTAGIVIEFELMQARFIADLWEQANAGISNWVSQSLYGRMFLTVKRDVQAKSRDSSALFRSLFHHGSGDYFLRNGELGVRGHWLPFAREHFKSPVGLLPPSLMRKLQDQPMTEDPGPLLHSLVATASIEMQLPFNVVESSVTSAVASIATDYLDKVYRDTFDRDPPG